jgi:uncharacterized protein YjbJ (UPF0337 family)
MNQDIAAGKWKQLRGLVRVWWGRLTSDELAQIAGHADRLIGRLQEHQGYWRLRAEAEFNRRRREHQARYGNLA